MPAFATESLPLGKHKAFPLASKIAIAPVAKFGTMTVLKDKVPGSGLTFE